ncbi:2,3-diphosphoglycerate-dependent phosphoglycerate mutase [Candidatus Methylacidithermus pantelleriae]|uniref:2,3-bisphosphoglycerate-dependent phosphoglycerate mutase n=1 Tax=Candidatus Methylacidithermus pantelleriae TaxID=2744239 RepID=A0A8J2BPJ0_9BACT|nr:2,3-diphosphoglycerate-dependent phosphoglycerate mutase [Candidatus Methylacidithermus pantelleriae]CAF0696371.1 Phosphoglycerate mutase (2,3-diphosphoglycerate dependent) [Candidatus Methylacidithermus pantelleriae]
MILVLLRHGESLWNQEGRFTGWTDVDLSPEGYREAERAGELLRQAGFYPEVAFSSVLKRAIRTLWIVLDRTDRMWVPVFLSWRLNERHYGSLQGLKKAEVLASYGEEQFRKWRRSFESAPPPLELEDPRHPQWDPRYREVPPELLPRAESLRDTLLRVLPYWDKEILPALHRYHTVVVSAHGNSLRALVMHLEQLSPKEVVELNIPTGFPLVYSLGTDGVPKGPGRYLGDPWEIQKAIEKIAAQGSKT